jgi:hypothetical protein
MFLLLTYELLLSNHSALSMDGIRFMPMTPARQNILGVQALHRSKKENKIMNLMQFGWRLFAVTLWLPIMERQVGNIFSKYLVLSRAGAVILAYDNH